MIYKSLFLVSTVLLTCPHATTLSDSEFFNTVCYKLFLNSKTRYVHMPSILHLHLISWVFINNSESSIQKLVLPLPIHRLRWLHYRGSFDIARQKPQTAEFEHQNQYT